MSEPEVSAADGTVTVPGGTIFFRRWNPVTASGSCPLILLHDSLGCVELWRDFPGHLARRLGVPVLAYDRLGFGRSSERKDSPGAGFIQDEAEHTFPALRVALGVKDFTLFGHSVGGAMALTIASKAGDSCRAVVSESAQAFVEDRTLSGIRAAKANFQQPEQLDRLRKWHGSKVQWVLDAWTEVWLSTAFGAWSLASDLPFVKCPILVIHGDGDEYGSVSFPEFICRMVGGPTELHILKGCGHVPHREQMDTVIDLVSGFWASSNLPAGRV
ncbi:MAG: alpha/beta hydrolase [Planctomycetes bacterium]|nr:alpha/beta hydrolase [Planctomycetota bacterium]